ncbi:hypothetical protein DFA_03524 [Cavenderia fasciculata]|uniref:Uncharacterized protein n=1 Tax=Cavenderia fasciculata TaxID=261658 RepID=F4PHU2_CACFS|nr:uncharacterized protein DFA_03524 [Cavenderia fasciculata]EGG25276.1 hypothetical protein DFA_03524 [Cavenderia fasciculata]|eukprot:XP_004363127.1 hypothetical protein DFA_03524 [Cavenderia fasciculata]
MSNKIIKQQLNLLSGEQKASKKWVPKSHISPLQRIEKKTETPEDILEQNLKHYRETLAFHEKSNVHQKKIQLVKNHLNKDKRVIKETKKINEQVVKKKFKERKFRDAQNKKLYTK